MASDGLQVERAVDLPPLPSLPDHPTPPEHRQVPRDPGLAHPKVAREVVDVDLAGLREPLQDLQPDRVRERLEVDGQSSAGIQRIHNNPLYDILHIKFYLCVF